MPTRLERTIHRDLLRGDTASFDHHIANFKDPTHFYKSIIEYDYKIRTHVFKASCAFINNHYSLRVKHPGWPLGPPMSPQAWTVMEMLTGLEHLSLNTSDNALEAIFEGIEFISTFLLRGEIDILWNNLLDKISCCENEKAELWIVIFMAFIIGLNNNSLVDDLINVTESNCKYYMKRFLFESRQIELLREIHHNKNSCFDNLMLWLYRNKNIKLALPSKLFALRQNSRERRHSFSSNSPPLSPHDNSSSSHPQSPSEQIEPLDLTFSPSFPPQE